MIRKERGRWTLYTSDGSRVLGSHRTKAEALAQEGAIHARRRSANPAAGDDEIARLERDVARGGGEFAARRLAAAWDRRRGVVTGSLDPMRRALEDAYWADVHQVADLIEDQEVDIPPDDRLTRDVLRDIVDATRGLRVIERRRTASWWDVVETWGCSANRSDLEPAGGAFWSFLSDALGELRRRMLWLPLGLPRLGTRLRFTRGIRGTDASDGVEADEAGRLTAVWPSSTSERWPNLSVRLEALHPGLVDLSSNDFTFWERHGGGWDRDPAGGLHAYEAFLDRTEPA